MQIVDRWFRDMPQQFLGKFKIEVLIEAFAKQLQEVQQVFDDLDTLTNLETASGKNLDYVGTIVPLSRKEAGELAEIGVTEPVISDERYRRFLKYKILRNTSECTYYDLVAGIELLWQYENIHYIEDPKHPAMIIFETPMLSLDTEDLVEFHASLCIRASGVGVLLRKIYRDSFKVEIKQVASITFFTKFYPRFNIPVLNLDGAWMLDGSQTLSGYDGYDRIDLYPVQMEMQTGVRAEVREETGITFLSGVQENVESAQEIEIRASAECGVNTTESLVIQTSASVDAGVGDVFVDNLNSLDDGWLLDGSRELNGGVYVL